MIETKEAGAGSYPSLPDGEEYKCYSFKTLALVEIESYIYTKDADNVEEQIENYRDWEEILKSKIIEIVDILEIREEPHGK